MNRLFKAILIILAIIFIAMSSKHQPTEVATTTTHRQMSDAEIQQAWDAQWDAFARGFKRGWVEGGR
jgi:hypothetical protein